VSQISVSYDRKFSDGNYGSEGLSVSWTSDELGEMGSEEVEATLRPMVRFLRLFVLGRLADSASERVRWAANRELHPEQKPADDKLAVTVPDDVSLEDLPF